MTDEFFFITFGGLGVSLAGFAGLIHALDRSGKTDSPITRWRIRSIVSAGFGVALSGLLVWPIYRITEDVTLTVRLISLFLSAQYLRLAWADLKPGPAWPEKRRWRVNVAISGVLLALVALNIVVGSVGFLEVLFVLALGQPIGTFIRAVGDLHRSTESPERGQRAAIRFGLCWSASGEDTKPATPMPCQHYTTTVS